MNGRLARCAYPFEQGPCPGILAFPTQHVGLCPECGTGWWRTRRGRHQQETRVPFRPDEAAGQALHELARAYRRLDYAYGRALGDAWRVRPGG